MSKLSRDKGARYEREIAHRYRDAGFTDAYRTAQFCGNTGHAADVEGVPGVHIEGKHREQLRLYEWIEQAERDAAGSGKIPAVHRRKNRRESLVTLRLNDFIELIKKAQI